MLLLQTMMNVGEETEAAHKSASTLMVRSSVNVNLDSNSPLMERHAKVSAL